MPRLTLIRMLAGVLTPLMLIPFAAAQERLPWERTDPYVGSSPGANRPDGYRADDTYRPGDSSRPNDAYPPNDAYRSGRSQSNAPPNDTYAPPPDRRGPAYGSDSYQANRDYGNQPGGYGAPYQAPSSGEPYERGYGGPGRDGPYGPPPQYDERGYPRTYSRNEILDAGHRFFGSISQGLAGAVEYVFQTAGRPNGYILGEDAGGAFVAGLRYGEGVLYTKDAGNHKVFWQGPSLGYDFGGEGSKTMVLVYNLRDPSDIYNRFGGVQGSAYLVGGVSVQFQKYGDVVLAPIRSGIGIRLGANVGYLKYTRSPTWNPF